MIAGDAAHMMPPFAGQGMNGGIRDALNLSWKLPLVLRGTASASFLDRYQQERRGHVVAATELANRLGDLIQPTSRVRAAVRDVIFRCLNLSSAGQRAFNGYLLRTLRAPRMRSGVFIPCATPSEGTSPLPGQLVVQPAVRTSGGETVWLDALLGAGFAVLGYDEDPERALDEGTRNYWTRLGACFVHVVPHGTAPTGNSVEDTSGVLGKWFGDHTARFIAVRPDKFCAAQFSAATAPAAAAAFDRLLRTPE